MAVWKKNRVCHVEPGVPSANPVSPHQAARLHAAGVCGCIRRYLSRRSPPDRALAACLPALLQESLRDSLPGTSWSNHRSGSWPECLHVLALNRIPSYFLSSLGHNYLVPGGLGGIILNIPGASTEMGQGHCAPHSSLLSQTLLALLQHHQPLLAFCLLSPAQLAGQPVVLPSSQPFPPQHLRVEDAEYRPGLRRELRRRVLRRSWYGALPGGLEGGPERVG